MAKFPGKRQFLRMSDETPASQLASVTGKLKQSLFGKGVASTLPQKLSIPAKQGSAEHKRSPLQPTETADDSGKKPSIPTKQGSAEHERSPLQPAGMADDSGKKPSIPAKQGAAEYESSALQQAETTDDSGKQNDISVEDTVRLASAVSPATPVFSASADDPSQAPTRRLPGVKVETKQHVRAELAEVETVHTQAAAMKRYNNSLPPFWPKAPFQKIWRTGRQKYALQIRLGLIFLVLLPTLLILYASFQAFMMYNQARSALQHITNVKTILTTNQNKQSGPFELGKLQAAQQEMNAAHSDFATLHVTLQGNMSASIATTLLPEQISTARALSTIGIGATEIGQRILQSLIKLSPSLQGPLLADDTKPLVTTQTLAEIRENVAFALPRLKVMEEQTHNIKLDSLPISEDQAQLIQTMIDILPALNAELRTIPNVDQLVGWLLGVGTPRTFLVQTVDRTEMRPTGGFTGQFAELAINGGRVGKFELQDIGPLEKNNPNARSNGQLPPAPYTWWPVPNWGLRDSNLSADFPTSAQLAIRTYNFEFAKQMDGLIVFSPALISRLLTALGPIYIPAYKETITAENLEERLHFYQLDNAGIHKSIELAHLRKEWRVNPEATTNKARKFFTRKVAEMLMERMRKASPDQYLFLAREMLSDLKSKDLQIYVSQPELQQLIAKYGSTSSIDRSNAYDALFFVQANVNANKATPYVHTTLHDTVQLDPKGGATHTLQIGFAYTQAGPIYGYDSYRSYLRIYTPPKARLLWSSGFDQGYLQPFCGGEYAVPCPRNGNVYGNNTLICPPNLAAPGIITTARDIGDYYRHPLNKVGPVTNTVSDEVGRGMFGGWIWFPKNCNLTVSLSYYVPPMGQQPYQLFVQRQAGSQNTLDLTILPPPGECREYSASGLHFHGLLSAEDKLFSLPRRTKGDTETAHGCMPPVKV